jgi:hypothetical protein
MPYFSSIMFAARIETNGPFGVLRPTSMSLSV